MKVADLVSKEAVFAMKTEPELCDALNTTYPRYIKQVLCPLIWSALEVG
jgi:hypothetical protein